MSSSAAFDRRHIDTVFAIQGFAGLHGDDSENQTPEAGLKPGIDSSRHHLKFPNFLVIHMVTLHDDQINRTLVILAIPSMREIVKKTRIPACAAIALVAALAMYLPSEARAEVAIVTTINFDFDSAQLRPDARQKLERVINLLKEIEDINVKVVGHTDSTGPWDYNQVLSVRRAESVYGYLIDAGINAGRLSVEGVGESQPLVPNNTRAGRAANRRVEFQVM